MKLTSKKKTQPVRNSCSVIKRQPIFSYCQVVFVCLLLLLLHSQAVQGQRSTFYVKSGNIYAPNGEKFIARGVNKMIFYNDRDGLPAYSEIAKTGSNIVRIFWFTTGTAAELDTTLQNCIAQKMIAVPAVWEATGKWQNLQRCVDYWSRPDIVKVLQKHKRHVWLNIANEAGDNDLPQQDYKSGYAAAVQQLRKAGLTVPLVIDAAGWGRRESDIVTTGAAIFSADPQKNIIFSWHPWDANAPAQRIKNTIDTVKKLGLPFIVGEFAHKSVGCVCCIDYKYILEYCQQQEIGWLAWEWGPGNSDCAEMDMTTDGTFKTLQGWGLEVAMTLPYSIKNTAKKPAIFSVTSKTKSAHKKKKSSAAKQ